MPTTKRSLRTPRVTRAALAAVLAAPLAACAHVAPVVGVNPAPHDTVVINDLRHAPYVGTTPVVSAALFRAGHGDPVAVQGVYWTSRTLLTAWVADDGTVTVLKAGRFGIGAEAAGLGTARAFQAVSNPVERVGFTEHVRDDVRPGDAVRVEARAFRGDGAPVGDAQITYAVESRGGETSAEVGPDGVFTASEPGVYTVVAECGGHADQATVVVRLAPVVAPVAVAASTPAVSRAMRMSTVAIRAPQTAKVKVDDGGFAPYVNTTLTLHARVWVEGERQPDSLAMPRWTTSDSSVAWVSGDGVVVFRHAGRVAITATHGGRHASRSFYVTEHPAAHMVLNTNAADVRPGQPVKFREQVWQRGGIRVVDARVNYAIVGRGAAIRGATISDERIFVARQPGVYTVIATIGGLADKVTIVVRPSELALGGE